MAASEGRQLWLPANGIRQFIRPGSDLGHRSSLRLERNGAFETATIEGLGRASLLSDERYLWYRPTVAALRVLKKIDAKEGCAREKLVAGPRCLRINNEDFYQ